MLLNEFLKEHRKVQELGGNIATAERFEGLLQSNSRRNFERSPHRSKEQASKIAEGERTARRSESVPWRT